MDELLKVLINNAGGGLAGALLILIIWRGIPELRRMWIEKLDAEAKVATEMRAMWRSIDRLTHLGLLRLVSMPHISPEVKEAVSTIISDIDTEEIEAKKRDEIEAKKHDQK